VIQAASKDDTEERTILKRWSVALPLGIFALHLIWNGVSTIPSVVLQWMVWMVTHPFADYGLSNYRYQTPFWLLFANAVGATSTTSYLVLCILTNIVALLTVWWLGTRKWGALAVLLFLAHPISYILWTWIGLEDAVTVICTAVLLFVSSRWLILGAVVLGTLNHPAMIFLMPSVLGLRHLSEPEAVSRQTLVFGAAGVGLGTLACFGVQSQLDFELQTRLDYLLGMPFDYWRQINLSHLPLVLYSFGFALWIPLVWCVRSYFFAGRRYFLFFLGCMMTFYGITFFSRDTTRIFALLSWAPMLHCLLSGSRLRLREGQQADAYFGQALFLTAILGWLAPHFFLWNGQVRILPFLKWMTAW